MDDGVPVIKVRDYKTGRVETQNVSRTSNEIDSQYKRSRLKTGDVLMAIRGTTGEIARVPCAMDGANITQDTARIRPAREFSTEFIEYSLRSDFLQRQISLNTVGQAVQGINLANVRKLVLPIPPPEERAVIVRILSLAASRGDLTSALTRHQLDAKKSLMEQLLSGKRRLPGFSAAWDGVLLGEVTRESKTRNRAGHGVEAVMAVTKANGMVPMRERTIGKSLGRYKPVKKNWFAYNPMRINIGSIARWQGDQIALVSPDYVVFKCDEEALDPGYFDQLRKTHRWAYDVFVAGNGSVRVRIYYSDLARIRVFLPPIDEQRAIIEVLETADREIELLARQLELYNKQARGLMQKLLTGQIRVKEAANA